ncbi:MAG: glycosyltransferase family 4 protein [Elusimicrobiota bacterium]
MKIAFIGQKGIPSLWGGIEAHVEELAVRMVSLGHSVDVYTRAWYVKDKHDNYKGVKLVHINSVNSKNFDAATYAVQAAVAASFQKYDIIHFHALGPAFFCWIPKMFGKNIVVTVHRLDWQADKWGMLARAFLQMSEFPAVMFPDRTIVVSKTMKKYFEEKYGKIVNYIPNGVTLPVISSSAGGLEKYGVKHKKYLLWMGRMTPEKRVEWVIKAYKKNRGLMKDKGLKLVLAGGSSATDEYVKSLHALAGDDPDIVFTGYVTGELKNEVFSGAKIFVMPSKLEGLPIALLEAMSYQLPCLVSDIEPHKEVITEDRYGMLHNMNDFDNLAEKMGAICSYEDSVLNGMGSAAREKVKCEYNWEAVVEDTLNTYHQVVK